ncbi:hypothetical protein LCX93_12020 [Sulfurimonas sp. SWIR-19]|uniref:HvfA family oxazolone/thioamide-modified RiPP metallophore n=1 Tax=Sulfurimonas sp. SWIR-19 TaxID=2878390 RepID=UPI001CF18AFC|nr:hypothetical protein [Sulfurimonas sp. SWIR-19]UCN00231.1 hypothetical protein LCX93_12020 [Sulfurimonas sp. SWIR-19]
MKIVLLTLITFVLFISACSDEKKVAKSSAPGMKCGSGKCGANMFDGSAALVKKKKNILAQMRQDDPRQDCVKNAKSTKKMYDCVRDPKTHIMTLKCGEGKCGTAMPQPKPTMKCGAGKCGGSMK